jgi:hypothetical protein
MKPEIPDLDEDVEEMKYIGEYLSERLRDEGVFTIQDLVEIIEDFGDPYEYPRIVKRRVEDWLRKIVLVNERALECCYPGSKVINGEECSYRARETNFRAHNAIIKLWRHYVGNPYRRWIPSEFRGYGDRRKYPRLCNMDVVYN